MPELLDPPSRSLRTRIAFLPPVEHAVVTARGAGQVGEPVRFVLGQLATSRTARYTLRGSGLTVFLRHRSGDVHILIEIERNRIYAPPPEVEAALAPLHRPLEVLDLGGNIGLFATHVFSRWPDARVTTFEPDPENARLLEATRRANGLEDRWTFVQAAAATADGEVRFDAGNFYNSQVVADGEEGVAVPAVDVLPLAATADVLKIDIEGSEWPILHDDRFRDVGARVVAMEWHLLGCPEPDARSAAVAALERAGFSVRADPPEDPRYGTLWAWRP